MPIMKDTAFEQYEAKLQGGGLLSWLNLTILLGYFPRQTKENKNT